MLQDYVSAAKKSFTDHTELRAQVNTTKAVTFLAGNMVSNTQNQTSGVSARVYKGGTYGFASGAEYSPENVKAVIKAATDNANFMDTNIKRGDPPLPSLTGAPAKIDLVKPIFDDVPQSYFIDYARAVDELIVKKFKKLTSRAVATNCLYMEKLLTVSDGSDSHWFQPRSVMYVTMTAETPEGVPVELYEVFGGMGRFDEFFKDASSIEAKLESLYKAVLDKCEGIHPSPGTKKVILHPDLAGMLAHEAVGHTVEADMVLGGSVAADNLNKQVASEMVTLIDFAHTYNGKTVPMPIYVDDEGTPAEDAVLIENGILKGYMHSRETARHFGVKPQGCARAFNF